MFGLINSTPHSARLASHEMARLLEQMAISALLGLPDAEALPAQH